MSAKERKEHERLTKLWMSRRASKAQMLRCMELDRKAEKAALA